MSTAPGAPVSQVRPGANSPPNDSPNTHTIRPQPALASPASRDSSPRGAKSSQRPSPIWIHTVAEPAPRPGGRSRPPGPSAPRPAPTAARRRRSARSPVTAARPACSAEPARSRRAATGCRIRSAAAAARPARPPRAPPSEPAVPRREPRRHTQAATSTARISSATSPWCSSALRNAAASRDPGGSTRSSSQAWRPVRLSQPDDRFSLRLRRMRVRMPVGAPRRAGPRARRRRWPGTAPSSVPGPTCASSTGSTGKPRGRTAPATAPAGLVGCRGN